MGLSLLSAPAAEPLALADAKAYLRIDTDAEDAVVSILIAGVRRLFERATGLALVSQTWRLTLDAWPLKRVQGRRMVPLPLRPVSAVSALVVDPGGAGEVTVGSGAYFLDPASFPPRLVEASPGDWPSPDAPAVGLRIDFVAGFGAAADVPSDIGHALLMMLAEAYERRGLARPGDPVLARPLYEGIVAPFREPRL